MTEFTIPIPQSMTEIKEGNFPGFCAIAENHEALVVDSGVHLPKEYLQLEKSTVK